ncbi:hypothetical protein [Desertivirga xinjiangensis]|uniref:hypothetical protein n=1 Tax=Desertivirga xinjiangensis TaxID=539206 RepID=UPI00210885AA|nr:hypothetical protein [Pedobacter xinjiangensis]
MAKSIYNLFLIGITLIILPAKSVAQTADTLLRWKEGYLDIHHFHTGRGNAAFFIFPDGTTMLVDAGEIGESFGPGQTLHISPAYPNDSLSAGEWVAAYIRQLMPEGRKPAIDYALITHFHADHYGNVTSTSKWSPSGKYRLSGITAVAEKIPVKNLIDRGFPLYGFPTDLRKHYGSDSTFFNYLSFVEHSTRQGMKADTLKVGATDQIKLLRKSRNYPTFKVRGIKSGGSLWESKTDKTYQLLKVEDIFRQGWFNENPLSLALKISYGKFDYFTGGDNTGLDNYETPPWFDVETPMAASVGKVEATTFNHHGNRDAMNENFLRGLSAKVLIQQTWCSDHPGQELAHRLGSKSIYPGNRDVFATYIHPETKVTYGSWFVNAYKSMEGHVLLRVLPGGDQFRVIIADTVNGQLKIKNGFGPYTSE